MEIIVLEFSFFRGGSQHAKATIVTGFMVSRGVWRSLQGGECIERNTINNGSLVDHYRRVSTGRCYCCSAIIFTEGREGRGGTQGGTMLDLVSDCVLSVFWWGVIPRTRSSSKLRHSFLRHLRHTRNAIERATTKHVLFVAQLCEVATLWQGIEPEHHDNSTHRSIKLMVVHTA